MPMSRAWAMVCILILSVVAAGSACAEGGLKAGAGRVVITPKQDMWMAGYAARKAPSQGKIHDLYAKALALEDESGARFVIVTTDLIGVSAWLSHRVAEGAGDRFQLPRDRLMITASHTHCGPVIQDNLYDMYGLTPEQAALVGAYSETLPGLILEAVDMALHDLAPAQVSWGIGTAGFARNRREQREEGIVIGDNPIGPVDHDVPTLVVRRPDGSIRALLFGYACHNTTLDFQQFCGDYAGFAQAHLEERVPGAVALFVAGCGGDQNPLPRRTLELARMYGEQLAQSVLDVANGSASAVHGPIRAVYREIPLELSAPPTHEQLEAQLQSENVYEQRRAKRLLAVLDEKGKLDTTYPYPIQIWQFADTLQMTVLGGEVVVDYSLRLKKELGRDRQFVIAYANDVCAYIPSLRVLREGGYEGGGAMVYYGFYGPWAESVEEDIMRTVHELSATKGAGE